MQIEFVRLEKDGKYTDLAEPLADNMDVAVARCTELRREHNARIAMVSSEPQRRTSTKAATAAEKPSAKTDGE